MINYKYIMPGLTNLGNTCYMNAVIQCIYHIEDLTNVLSKKGNINYIKSKSINNSIFVQLNNFFQKYKMETNSISPTPLRNTIMIKNSMFRNFLQHDSHELLLYLYDEITTEVSRSVNMNIKCNKNILEYKSIYKKLNESKHNKQLHSRYKKQLNILKKKYIKDIYIIKSLHSWKTFFEKNYSDLIDLIYGQLLSSISCDECYYMSIKFEPFTILSLEIPDKNNITLTDCISNFIKEETLSLGEQWKCSQCKKVTKSSKQISYWNLPKILTIHLKRFTVVSQTKIIKNDKPIKIEIDNLDLHNYISDYNYENTDSKMYECVGIICHTGSYVGGHYFSFCKKNTDWYLCNDSTYKKINLKFDIIEQYGYIFFYKRIE